MIRLATSPEPHKATTARSVLAMFKANNMTHTTHRNIPAPDPDPEPNPEPDAAISAQQCDITPADWDVLFHAVTARLQACSGPATAEQLSEHVPEHLLGVTASLQATVRECVASLNQLHAVLTRERQQRRRPQ